MSQKKNVDDTEFAGVFLIKVEQKYVEILTSQNISNRSI